MTRHLLWAEISNAVLSGMRKFISALFYPPQRALFYFLFLKESQTIWSGKKVFFLDLAPLVFRYCNDSSEMERDFNSGLMQS